MRVFHPRDVDLASGCSLTKLWPDHFVLGRVVMVQRRRDEVDVPADDRSPIGVPPVDVAD